MRQVFLQRCSFALVFLGVWLLATPAFAQVHDHAHMNMAATGWQFMQDGIMFAELNRQGSDRGGTEFVVPNWWMGIGTRKTAHGDVMLTGMFSLDPATVGRDGYREIFQVGETLDGRPLIDRQHPHDFFMQLAAAWRISITDRTGFTLTGAPVGEPALGPVAFMHRASAVDNPTAPLGHHTFDSTHISFGVVTAAVDHGKWTVEGSLFNGREPDDRRWDFDFGRLDSFSGRVWFKPTATWEFQASSGRLKEPEALEPGNIVRSTASASWTRASGSNVSALTFAYGRNDSDHGARNAVLIEAVRRRDLNTVYGRFEALQVETALLQSGHVGEGPAADIRDPVYALTIGGVRDVFNAAGLQGGFGADVTFYATPDPLAAAYSGHPVSFHLFFRLRPKSGMMGPMWNMRMGQLMGH
jgi:hypothetical protein